MKNKYLKNWKLPFCYFSLKIKQAVLWLWVSATNLYVYLIAKKLNSFCNVKYKIDRLTGQTLNTACGAMMAIVVEVCRLTGGLPNQTPPLSQQCPWPRHFTHPACCWWWSEDTVAPGDGSLVSVHLPQGMLINLLKVIHLIFYFLFIYFCNSWIQEKYKLQETLCWKSCYMERL